MAKSETKRYIDVNPASLSPDIQAMLKEDRKLYEQTKALRERIVEAIKVTYSLKGGYEVVGIGFTRWGQFQFHADIVQAKASAKASNRPSLADFLDTAASNGQRA